jgi:hypothetical protein
MNSQEPVRTLDGKPAVFGGVSAEMGNKVAVIVENRLRLLTRRNWERLPLWVVPQPPAAMPRRRWRGYLPSHKRRSG